MAEMEYIAADIQNVGLEDLNVSIMLPVEKRNRSSMRFNYFLIREREVTIKKLRSDETNG